MRRQIQKGSLKKVDGHWVARWREGGRERSQVIGYYPKMRQAEAENILAQIVQPVNARRLDLKVRKTFEQFVKDPYLPFYGRKWKRSTLAANTNRISVHLLPVFGDKAIADLGWKEMQRFLDEKAADLSYSVVAHLRWDLRQILHMAVIEQEIDRNPAELLFVPRVAKRPEHRVMAIEEARQCLTVLDERERLMVGLAVLAGMRPGEILALRCGRVSSDLVDIRERVYKGDLDTPKTVNSVRQVVVPRQLMTALHAWIERLPQCGPEDWVFPSERLTTPATLTNVWQRHIRGCPAFS